MDFLEDVFENLFRGNRKKGWGSGHHGGSGQHRRRGYSGGGFRTCPQCGTENNPDSQFCMACGTTLRVEGLSQSLLTCDQCGAQNQPSASFCMNCGTRLRAVSSVNCPGCGTLLPAAARFCPNCGREVSAG